MSQKLPLFKRDWNIVDKWKYYFIASSIIIILGIILLCVPKIGFNLGIDFEGGYSMEIKYGPALTKENYSEKLAEVNEVVTNLTDSEGNKYNLEIARAQMQGEAEGASILIRFKAVGDEQYMEQVTQDLKKALIERLTDVENPYVGNVMDSSTISQTVSSELLFAAIAAIYLGLLLMLVYITIRFELKSGLAAVVALFHDVLIVVAFMVFSRIEINSTFIAAIITLIGYSINNTVVIFDRIRENLKNPANANLSSAQIANASIKESFWRTFNSSLTTLFTITVLAIIGVSAIREFALPIIVGLLSGIYSSLCLAPSVWTLLNKPKSKKPQAQTPEKATQA
ncbi:MAG TPA: protein translocase subunit SecF [Clostridiales bacterium]|nr:protein translocase subunit SecF [Clostridiales bacterium]